MAKYVMTWQVRDGGSAADNEASAKRSLAVFSSWTPPADVTFVEFLTRADGQGGFAVVTTDNLASLTAEMAKFAPYNQFTLYPVHEIADGVGLSAEAIAFRESVS
jgi:hypothetical protein